MPDLGDNAYVKTEHLEGDDCVNLATQPAHHEKALLACALRSGRAAFAGLVLSLHSILHET